MIIDDTACTYMSTTEPQLAKQEASKAFLFPPNTAILAGSQMSPPLYSAILFGPPGKSVLHDTYLIFSK